MNDCCEESGYSVPRWISRPSPPNLPAIRRAVGDPAAKPGEIDPITPLPAELSRLRNRWLEEAKKLNGNCLCLIPPADDVIVFRLRRRLYAVRRESFSMDNHAFEVSYDEICRDLERIGCERIQS